MNKKSGFKKTFQVCLLSFVMICCLFSFAAAESAMPFYDVVKRDAAPIIDGNLDEEVWQSVPDISGGFHFPWDPKEVPATVFKAYHDGSDFYFSFDITDGEVLASEEWVNESTVDNEDRAELFFAAADVHLPTPSGMPTYFCIEVDPKGRVHDYSVVYYRHFDSEWNMADLKTAAVVTETGYTIEGSVPLQTFRDLNLISADELMRVGVYRAEFSSQADSEDILMEWISWINPKTEAPDYHVNSSFGEFRFLK